MYHSIYISLSMYLYLYLFIYICISVYVHVCLYISVSLYITHSPFSIFLYILWCHIYIWNGIPICVYLFMSPRPNAPEAERASEGARRVGRRELVAGESGRAPRWGTDPLRAGLTFLAGSRASLFPSQRIRLAPRTALPWACFAFLRLAGSKRQAEREGTGGRHKQL